MLLDAGMLSMGDGELSASQQGTTSGPSRAGRHADYRAPVSEAASAPE
jgi:hypothetical protein